MRKLATIAKISALTPIQDADKLETATVRGWEVVVQKGEFKVGDLCVYIEIDSQLPERPEFEFLRSRKFRIRTIKLRGQLSQGICFPLTILSGYPTTAFGEGVDVTEALGITKYDPQAAQEAKDSAQASKYTWVDKLLMRYAWYRKLRIKPSKSEFPKWIVKTDEERIQNMTKVLDRFREKNVQFMVREKLDGSSITCFVEKKRGLFGNRYEFGVCSRNLRLPTREGKYWEAVKLNEVEYMLTKYAQISGLDRVYIQGELVGPGIQGNKYKLTKPDIYFFTVRAFRNGESLYDYTNVDISQMLAFMGQKVVPHVSSGISLPPTMAECLAMAEGKSKLNPEIEREGIVLRWKNTSFKIINNKFLLENED